MDPHASAPGGTMLSTQVDPAASLERFKAQQRHPWAANDELGLAHESADAAPGVVAADVAVDVAGTTPGMTSAPWEVASYEPPLSPELADAIQDLWGPLDSSAQLEEEMPMWGPTRGAQGTGMPSGHQAGPAGGSLQRNGGAPADSGDKGSAAPGAENGGEPMGPQESPAQHAGSAPLGAKQGPAQADPQRPSLAGRLASVLEKIKAKEASQNALKDYTLFRRNLEAQTGDGDRLEAAQLGTPLGPSVQVGVPGASQGEASRGGIGAVQVHGGDIAVHGGQSAARGSKHASVLLRLPSSGNGVAAGLATAEASSMGGRRDAVERPVPINATWQAGQSRQAAGVGHWGGQEAQVLVGEPSVGSGLGGQGMVGTQGLRSGEGAHPGSGVGNQAPPSRLGEELMMRFLQEAGVGPQAHPGPLTRQLQGTLRQQYLQDQLQQMEGHNQLESQRPDQPHNHEGKGMQQLLVFHHPAKQQSGGLESQSQKQGPAVGQQQKLHPFSPLPAASFNSGSSDSETLSGIPSDARVGSPSVNARLSGSLSESHHGPHSPASGSRLAATHTPLLLDSQAPSPTLTGLRLPSGVPQPEALFSSPDSPPESAREEKPLPELRHAAGGSHELASRLSTGALGGSQELASRLSADAVQSSFSSGDGGPSSVALARVLESRGSGSVASNLRGGDSLAQHMLSDAHALSELDSLAQSNGVKGVNSLAAIDNLAAANIRAQLGTLAQLASLARGRAVEGISSQADIDTLAEGFPLAGSGSDILAGVRRPEFDSLSGVQNLLGLRSMNTAELQRRWGVPHPTGSASDAEQHARQTPQAAAVGAVEQGSDEVPGSGAFVYGRTMGAREDGTWELTLAPALRRRGQQTSSGFLLASQLTPQESSLEASQEAALEGLLGNPWAMQRAQEAVLGAAAAGRQRRGVPGSHGVAEFLLSEVPEKVTGRVPRVYVRPRGSVTARDFHLGHPELRRIVLARLTKAATAYSSHQHVSHHVPLRHGVSVSCVTVSLCCYVTVSLHRCVTVPLPILILAINLRASAVLCAMPLLFPASSLILRILRATSWRPSRSWRLLWAHPCSASSSTCWQRWSRASRAGCSRPHRCHHPTSPSLCVLPSVLHK